MFNSDKFKIYALGFASAIIFVFAIICVFSVFNIGNNKPLPVDNTIKNMYATVYKANNGSIVVEPIDEEIGGKYTIETDEEFKEGDFVLVNGDDVTLIAAADEFETTTKSTTSRTTKDKTVTTKKTSTTRVVSDQTTKKTSTTKKTTTKKITTTKNNKNADDEVIAYVRDASTYAKNGSSSDETFGQKAKRYFITVVDFIFYDGEIKGYKWDELTTTAKAKVVYYALILDSKIDEKFPDYKNSISSKYQDVKAKLVAKYLDLTDSICNKDDSNRYHCDVVKQDFELLKKSVGITWDVVVDAFKYAYDKTANYLKTWYETFSGK